MRGRGGERERREGAKQGGRDESHRLQDEAVSLHAKSPKVTKPGTPESVCSALDLRCCSCL